MSGIEAFVRESNLIEGIYRDPTDAELSASESFLKLWEPSLTELNALQAVYAPDMPLRECEGMNVRVGSYIAPAGSPHIKRRLLGILREAGKSADPWRVHCSYEMLHPYLDGNGRTGRMLWAWMMNSQGLDPFALPFLHRFYYQTLEHQR